MGGSPVKESEQPKSKRTESSQDLGGGSPVGLIFLVLAVLGALAWFLKFRNKKNSDSQKKSNKGGGNDSQKALPVKGNSDEPKPKKDPVEPHPEDEIKKRFAH